MTPRSAIVVVALAGLLAACGETTSKTSIGSVAGTLSGGLIGASKAEPKATNPAAAPLLAAWAGSPVAARLDETDRRLAAEAEYEALESTAAGASRDWRNAATGHRGSVTPGPAYSVNQYTCRDYVDQITVDGKAETVRATACRQPDGSWRPIS
jgi:surface antigen